MLIMTATVGEGHDAAALAVEEQLRDLDPSIEVRVESMSRVSGHLVENLIVKAYRFQLTHAPWSYKWLYDTIITSRPLTSVIKLLCGVVGGARTQRLVESADPDVVLSTYPLTSAMLEWLKIKGRLKIPCANLLTDFAPHPMWTFKGLDVNYVMNQITTVEVEAMIAGAPTQVVAPPVSPRFFGPVMRLERRRKLGARDSDFVVLITGGGWGVGNLENTARVVSSVEGTKPVVLCALNDELKEKLLKTPPPNSVILGFVDYVPELLDAADLLVHNAGGLTSLEAMVRACPIVITDPIPGHGLANAKLMDRSDTATWARDSAELVKAVQTAQSSRVFRRRAERLAGDILSMPTVAQLLIELAGQGTAFPGEAAKSE